MKHLRLVLVCVALVLTCMLTMVACDGDNTPADTTADTTASDTTADTSADTVADTEAGEADTTADTTAEDGTSAEDGTAAEDETGAEFVAGDYFDGDPDTVVIINTAEDLMAFNQAINNADPNEYWFWDETVVFTADIDMTGHEWTPLNGAMMDAVTFDGQGHTISNLTFKTHKTPFAPGTAPEDAANYIGSGFVGIANANLTFKGLTLDNCSVVAHERAVGNFVGLVVGMGEVVIAFEDCKSTNFTVDGWKDITDTNAEERITICQRASGFIGHLMAGATATFKNCAVENITMSAFQNMAGFIGYDGTGSVDEYSFENCSVSGAQFTFGYGMRKDSNTGEIISVDVVAQEKKYVAVFFNGSQWVDKTQACVDMGNTFDSVSYYDFFNDNTEYTPTDFRSWDGVEETPEA